MLRRFHGEQTGYRGLTVLSPKLRITEPINLNSEITEVSIFYRDGWQHCIYSIIAYVVVEYKQWFK